MIKIPREVIDRIILHGNVEAPIEACGYLAGRGEEVRVLVPMTNAENSDAHYSFDPEEQFAALDKAKAEDLELIAAYHTHPITPARMSDEDIHLAAGLKCVDCHRNEIVYVIYSLKFNNLRAFRINGEKLVREITIEVV